MRNTLVFLFLVALAQGCGEPTTPTGSPGDAAAIDAAAIDAAAIDAALDAPRDVPASDGAIDAPPTDAGAPDTPPADAPPARCPDGTACDGLLDDAGLCGARCVPAEYALRCHGETRAGVCLGAPPITTSTYERDGWERAPVTIPAEAVIGEAQAVVFSLRNTGATARPLAWRVTPLAGWVIESEDPPSGSTHDVPPGASVQVTARMRPTAGSALDPGRQVAATVGIDGVDARGGWPIFIPARYPDGEGVRCGDRWFPEYIAGTSGNYGEARCCDGVFYPAAQCCVSSDCVGGGACADGRCLRGLTSVAFSATPLAGPQRVLVVLVDSPHAPAADPCADRTAELREELGLDDIEQWYARVAVSRIGRPAVSWRWTVLAGLRGATIGLPTGSVTPEALHQQTEAWLRARGCLRGFDADHDRIVVYAPSVDLGPYGGMVFRTHRVAQRSLGPALTAHELAHTFGATDRYLDLGGSTQWAGTLMANAATLSDAARDDVLWAEVGLGDADRDGVIDVHQAALAPDALSIATLRVSAYAESRSLVYSLSFDVRERGRSLRNIPQQVTLSLPGTDLRIPLDRWDALGGGNDGTWIGYLFAPRDLPMSVIDDALRDGRLRVRVEATLYSTRADFSRASLSLDETRDVTLTPRGAALLAPPRPADPPVHGGRAR
jgi:hypothetical protein